MSFYAFHHHSQKHYGTYLATQLALFSLQLPTMLVAVDRAFESAWKYLKQIIKQKRTIGLLQSRHEFYYVNWWAAFDRIEQTDPEFTSQPPCIGRVGYRETNGASCMMMSRILHWLNLSSYHANSQCLAIVTFWRKVFQSLDTNLSTLNDYAGNLFFNDKASIFIKIRGSPPISI